MNLSLILGADGILPLPCGYEVTAGKTHCGKACFLKAVDEVASEALLIRRGMLGIEHGTVDHGSDRL